MLPSLSEQSKIFTWHHNREAGNVPSIICVHYQDILRPSTSLSVLSVCKRDVFPPLIHINPLYTVLSYSSTKTSQYFEALHSMHSCRQSLLLFQLNALNMLNTYTYHQLPPEYLFVPQCCLSFNQFILGVPIVVN